MAMENGRTAMQKDERPFEERYAEYKEKIGKRIRRKRRFTISPRSSSNARWLDFPARTAIAIRSRRRTRQS